MARDSARKVTITRVVTTCLAIVALVDAQVEPQPTFRSEINYVQIPVRVLDAHGEFVSGLIQSDFQIFEDGQAQAIAAFSAVEIPSAKVDAMVPDAPLGAVDAVASNDPVEVDGRVYVFVLDNQSMSESIALRTRHVVRGFIRQYLKANDLTAVVFTGAGRGQHFTRNRRLLDDAIGRLLGDPDPTDDAAHRSMTVIAETARSMGAIKGRRKALVLMSPSPICSLSEMDLQSVCREDARYALRMAMQSDVSIYTIDPGGLNTSLRSRAEHANPNSTYSGGAYSEASNGAAARAAFSSARTESRGPDDAARYLAEQSGGFAVVNTNSLSAGFERVARENSSYYLLGYYSTNHRADGQARRNEVKVARTGVRVVHRASYLAPRAKADLNASTTSIVTRIDDQLQALANNPLPVSGMPLRVAAVPFASAAGTSVVSVVVEIPARTLPPIDDGGKQASRARLSIGFYDRKGRAVGSEDPTIDLSPVPGETSRFVSNIPVPPGVYRLWVGAVAIPSRITGSAMTDVEVPDFSRPRLSLSGITLSIGGPSLAARHFSTADDLSLCGEVYDRRKRIGVVVGTVTVRSGAGREVYQTPFEPDGLRSRHCARIPLKQLGAGTYSSTVEVVSTSPSHASASRTSVFSVERN
jgi:VWFA-related protein